MIVEGWGFIEEAKMLNSEGNTRNMTTDYTDQ